MKAITVVQPLAQLFIMGEKNLHVTLPDSAWRGEVAIVASTTVLPMYQYRYISQMLQYDNSDHPERAVVGVGEIKDVQKVVDVVHGMRRSERHTTGEKRVEDAYDKYAYQIVHVRPITPIAVPDDLDLEIQGVWELPESLSEQVMGAYEQVEKQHRGTTSQEPDGIESGVSGTSE